MDYHMTLYSDLKHEKVFKLILVIPFLYILVSNKLLLISQIL